LPSAEAPPRCFVVERTLGRLARWLRLLGHSARLVERAPAAAPPGVAVLTRRRALGGRPGVMVVEPDQPCEQLRQVAAAFGLGLEPDRLFSRCLDCDRPVEPLARPEAVGLVPEHVLHTAESFTRCPACGKVFWPGTHGPRARAMLAEILGPARGSSERR
jgi:hypothetical protein